jgi:hypothetical protein
MRIFQYIVACLLLSLTSLGQAQTANPNNLQNCLTSYLSTAGRFLYLKNVPQGQLVDSKNRLFSLPITPACTNYPALQRVLVKVGPNEVVQYIRFDFSPNKGEIVAQFDARAQLAIYAQINRSSEKVAFHPFTLYPQNPASKLTYVLVMKNGQYTDTVTYGGLSSEEHNE